MQNCFHLSNDIFSIYLCNILLQRKKKSMEMFILFSEFYFIWKHLQSKLLALIQSSFKTSTNFTELYIWPLKPLFGFRGLCFVFINFRRSCTHMFMPRSLGSIQSLSANLLKRQHSLFEVHCTLTTAT